MVDMQRTLAIPAGLALMLLAGLGAHGCRHDPPPQPDAVEEEPPDEVKSPYRNAQPGVAYVGDAACAGCHDKEIRSYARHPMSRSFAPTAANLDRERLDAKAGNPFETNGYKMLVERRGRKLFHIERYVGDGDKVLAEIEDEVQYVLGSGAQGRTYVIHRDGRLYQSSISWFTARQSWGLAPGYEARTQHFFRPISADCLFCHANRVEPVQGSMNRYREPIFHGYAIGCERCHGPAELHVKERGTRDSIVNPRRLEHSLREAICQQCHLQGQIRVARRGRDSFDFRPGLPLEAVWSVFVQLPESTDGRKSVSATEQMYLSRCFHESTGKKKLGCISCHNPHDYPAEENKVDYYRGRCLTCHNDKSCTLTPEARRATDPQDNCVRCHMPRSDSSNIVHTATTDHRIVRSADKPPKPQPVARQGIAPLIDFQREFTGRGEEPDARDLGVALASLASSNRTRARQQVAGMALPLLKKAVARAPTDLAAREALGTALWLLEDHDLALAAFGELLAREPGRELALELAAENAADFNRVDTALALWQRLLKLDPDHPRAHPRLASLLVKKQQWRKAEGECNLALRRNPFDTDARRLLVLCHVKTGNTQRARAELDTLLAMNPTNKKDLQRWFDEVNR
jgi:Flp pilus assembly protein TadD